MKFSVQRYFSGFCTDEIEAKNKDEAYEIVTKLPIKTDEIMDSLEPWQDADQILCETPEHIRNMYEYLDDLLTVHTDDDERSNVLELLTLDLAGEFKLTNNEAHKIVLQWFAQVEDFT